MSESGIEKKEQLNPDEVLAAITSFNDVSIITNIFRELGWTYSIEIRETLTLAKQNANLSIKFKAIRHLRELLREAAETSGYVATVSSTTPNAAGGHTTFSAKRIAGILNPVKQIESTEIKEVQNGKEKEQGQELEQSSDSDRECDRGQSQTENLGESINEQPRPDSRREIQKRIPDRPDSSESIRDTRRAFPIGDADSGDAEPPDGSKTTGQVAGGTAGLRPDNKESDNTGGNPCIKTRPPTCDRDLFPGISSAED